MTLKDIANEAGVSIMTVSNVINNKKNVSIATRQKVLDTIKKYNYIPNTQARNLSRKSSGIILIVTPSNLGSNFSFYGTSLLAKIEEHISRKNYHTMIYSKNDFDEIYRLIKSWNIDGVIFLSTSNMIEVEKLKMKINIPIVVFDNKPISKHLIYINVDDEKGGYLQTKFLIENGHKKIAFASNQKNNFVLNNRFMGYKKALRENNISLNENFVFDTYIDFHDGLKIGERLINMEATAVVVTADLLAFGIMEKYISLGGSIPDDLSIIGYDDLDICKFVTPKLSSISQNLEKKGDRAVDELINAITGQKVKKNIFNIDVKLVNRQSTKKRSN